MSNVLQLGGKAVLITGIGGGMGRTAAQMFCDAGASVVGCDMDRDSCDETVRLVKATGGTIAAMAPVDLGDPHAARNWVDAAAQVYGGIDVLYNNASTQRFGSIEELTTDDWDFTMRNELNLVFYTVKAAWPHLIKRGGGSIINVGSIAGIRGVEFQPQNAHGTAKGGVISLTQQLVTEGGKHNIRANVISPGLIETPNTRRIFDNPFPEFEKNYARLPLGRHGQPEDVVNVALFLASDIAGWINGANIVIDGGASVLG
jgi:meso-butanediol dehydrogenase / (S,S)-butanediol dehydrogenase / diacetyl reductase